MATTPTSSGPGAASSRTVPPQRNAPPSKNRQTDVDSAASRYRQSGGTQVIDEKSRPRLHAGRPVRRDIESDDDSSPLVESRDEDMPPAPAFAPSSRLSAIASSGNASSTTSVASSQEVLPSSQPRVRDVARPTLSTATRVSQEYIDAHLPHRLPHNAVLRKDLHALRTILQRDKAQVDALDEKGRTALHLAAASGQLEFVKALLEAGADVNSCGGDRATPLLLAATNGHAAVVAVLMAHGGNPRALDNNGVEPIEMASRVGRLSVVEALIRHPLAFEKRNMDQAHPLTESLCLAARHGHEAIVKTLLDEGVPASALDRSDMNALMHAIKGGHLNLIKTLLQHTSLAVWDIDAPSLVAVAVEDGSPQALDLLLKHGDKVARNTSRRKTVDARSPIRRHALAPPPPKDRVQPSTRISLSTMALLQAAAQGKPAMVEIALQWGGSLTDLDPRRNTALMAALTRAGFDVATIPTIDLLMEEEARRTREEKAGRKQPERDTAVYRSESLVDRPPA